MVVLKVSCKVPLGWTISPALLQLGPAVLAYLAQVRLPRRPAAQLDFWRIISHGSLPVQAIPWVSTELIAWCHPQPVLNRSIL